MTSKSFSLFIFPFLFFVQAFFVMNLFVLTVHGKTEGSDKEKEKEVEKIEVTGTRMRRIDLENYFPVRVFDQEYLRRTGATTLGDALRESPFIFDGVSRERVLRRDTGAQSLDSDSLILINGRGVLYEDATAFPLSLIDRVEYLEYGTQGIYGVSSVLNIHTKKNSIEKSASVRYSHPFLKDGKRMNMGLNFGHQFNHNFNLTAAFDYRFSQHIWAKDRDFSEEHFSPVGSPGTVALHKENGLLLPKAHPDCPSDRIQEVEDTRRKGTFCEFNAADFYHILPSIHQYGGLLNAFYRATDKVSLFTEVSFSLRNSSRDLPPTPMRITRLEEDNLETSRDESKLILPSGNGDFSNTNPEEWEYRFLEAGNRVGKVKNFIYNIQSSLNVDFTDRWDGKFNFSWNQSFQKNIFVSGTLKDEDSVIDSVENGTFKPFASTSTEENKGVAPVSPHKNALDFSINDKRLFFGAQSSYHLFDWPWKRGGPFVISLFAQWDHLETTRAEGKKKKEMYVSAGRSDFSNIEKRQFYNFEIYSHFLSFLETSFSSAFKFDNVIEKLQWLPQFSFKSQILPSFLLRGSYEYIVATVSEKYKKPDLIGYGASWLVNHKTCNENTPVSDKEKFCTQTQEYTKTFGNPNLKPSKTWRATLGTFFQPFQNFSLDLTGWYLAAKDKNITNANSISIFKAENDDSLPGELSQLKVTTTDKKPKTYSFGQREGKFTYYIMNNAMKSYRYGFDLNAFIQLPWTLFGGHIDFKESLVVPLSSVQKVGNVKRELSGLYGSLKWRSNSALTWRTRLHNLSLVARFFSGTKKFLYRVYRDKKHDFSPYFQLDLDYKLAVPWKLKSEFGFGVKNILNAKPPLDSDATDRHTVLLTQYYEPRGTFVYINYKQYF